MSKVGPAWTSARTEDARAGDGASLVRIYLAGDPVHTAPDPRSVSPPHRKQEVSRPHLQEPASGVAIQMPDS